MRLVTAAVAPSWRADPVGTVVQSSEFHPERAERIGAVLLGTLALVVVGFSIYRLYRMGTERRVIIGAVVSVLGMIVTAIAWVYDVRTLLIAASVAAFVGLAIFVSGADF
jgi:hypothetical protein